MSVAHILIADDEAQILELLEEELSSDGYSVSTARNGYETVLKALDKPVDLLIVDMVMPKLNGVEVITILKKVYPHLPIIAFTGHIGEGYMSETMSRGAVDCIKKPFRMAYLKDVVKNALDKAGAGGKV